MPNDQPQTPEDATLKRFKSQREFYSGRGKRAKRLYYGLKVPEVLAAIAIPVLALLDHSAVVLGVVGATVAALAILQDVFQPNANWVKYRTANELLKREKALLDAESGRYNNAEAPMKLFAARVEDIIADENAGWAARTEASSQTTGG